MSAVLPRAPHRRSVRHQQPSSDRACEGKLCYPTRAHARAVALWMTIYHREDFSEYWCWNCCSYHVGHTEPLPRKRRGSV